MPDGEAKMNESRPVASEGDSGDLPIRRVLREWGRIGYRGQMLVEQHDDEGRAVNALMKLSAMKKRRGYLLPDER